ncbi:MAG: MFS transporter [Chloroflexi bacterium]|nr:MFS transporter [Chloroflexota bacterium]
MKRIQLKQISYGWWVVATLAITETISWGVVYYAYSVLITTLEAEFGWSRTAVTGAFSLGLLIAGGMAIPVGFWLDKQSARGLMTLGSIVASLLMFALSRVQTLTQLYLVWIGLGMAAATILYEPAFVVIAKWFEKERRMALTIVTIAAGFASTIFLPLTAWLLRLYGWRQAVVWLAIILAMTTIPLHAFVLRAPPKHVEKSPILHKNKETVTKQLPLKAILRQAAFWGLVTSFALGSMASIGMRVHFIPYMADRGFEPSFAAWIAGIIGAFQVLGRVIFAPSGRNISAWLMVAVLFVGQGIAIAILLLVPTTFGVWLFVICFGAVRGATTLARPALLADRYGSGQYGRISSIQYLFQTLASTSAPFGVALLYTLFSNNYSPVILILVIISLLAAGAVIFTRGD